MIEQPRIAPDEVLAAYATTGLRPVFVNWSGVGCGCPVVAIAEASGEGHRALDWSTKRYGCNYLRGFLRAVDGDKQPWESSPRLSEGYADGRAVRQAIIDAGLMEAVG